MGYVQFAEKFFPSILSAIFVTGIFAVVQTCHPRSRELHVCLNIYLEKDQPFIEKIVQGHRQARVLLEDSYIEEMCMRVVLIYDCYNELLGECDSYWQLDRYIRLMNLLNATHTHLCARGTENIKDLLNTDCLIRARDKVANCSGPGFNWLNTWREILKMQITSVEACPNMDEYRTCLQSRLGDVMCGDRRQDKNTAQIYGSLVDAWISSWCYGTVPYISPEHLFHPV